MTECYDAADWRLLPHGSLVLLCGDGNYTAPADAATVLDAKQARYITISDSYRTCGALDWEQGNPCFTAAGIRGYVRGRRSMNVRARIYCDRANASEALFYLKDYGHGSLYDYPGLVFWIATLDDVHWTADALAKDLADNWDAPIPASRIWANQFSDNGSYDSSDLFLTF